VVDLLKRDGFLGLYNGLNSSLLGIAVTNGCATPFCFARVLVFKLVTTVAQRVLLLLRGYERDHHSIPE